MGATGSPPDGRVTALGSVGALRNSEEASGGGVEEEEKI